MKDSSVNLAALIGSRICHDLISPIGAITNGLELLDLAGAAQGPEMSLIADSVGNAGARIRFFRIAYGAADGQLLSRAEVVSVLDDLGRGGRLDVEWALPEAQPRTLVRLAFLALQCCETALPFGGTVRITAKDGNWKVIGRAGKLNVDASLWDGLSRPDALPAITPALVQFALLPELAADLGRNVRTTRSETAIELDF